MPVPWHAPNKADKADEDDGEGVGYDVVEVVSLLVDPEHTRKIDRVPLPHQQRQAVHGGAESQVPAGPRHWAQNCRLCAHRTGRGV